MVAQNNSRQIAVTWIKMPISPLAGQSPTPDMLVNVPRLITAYYNEKPDVSVASQRVSFGTSGHRGSSYH